MSPPTSTSRRIRGRVLVALPVVVAVGFALKYHRGPAQWLLNNWGSSLAYEIMFMLLALFAFPRRTAITPIAIAVCLGTIALEFLQLWQPPWLQAVRATRVGAWVLGTSFSWADLPAYPLGCAAGWVVLRWLSRGAAADRG